MQDPRPSALCQVGGMAQQAATVMQPSYTQLTVSEYARHAIGYLTKVYFFSKSDFDEWYKDYPNRTQRLGIGEPSGKQAGL